MIRCGSCFHGRQVANPPRSGLKRALPAGQSPSKQGPTSRATPGEKGLLAIYTHFWRGPHWGQVSPDNQCHPSGKPASGEALISPHLHRHSNRKRDSHCFICKGFSWPSQLRAQFNDPAGAAHTSPVPRQLAEAPAGHPVRCGGRISAPGYQTERIHAGPAASLGRKGRGRGSQQ